MAPAPAALLAAAVLAGCGSSAGSSTRTASGTTASSSAATPPAASTPSAGSSPGCRPVSVPAARGSGHLSAPTQRLAPGHSYVVKLTTNCGSIEIALDTKDSPKTSASFAALVRRGFFDGLTFHRVAAGFVIQGGDPAGDGSGGPGYTVVEAPPANLSYAPGVVAMAKTANEPPGASGSQFFIVTGSNGSSLPPEYALLGRVVSGFPTALAIGSIPTNPPQDGAPTAPVVISRATLITR